MGYLFTGVYPSFWNMLENFVHTSTYSKVCFAGLFPIKPKLSSGAQLGSPQ
jgi:hypothetical protein